MFRQTVVEQTHLSAGIVGAIKGDVRGRLFKQSSRVLDFESVARMFKVCRDVPGVIAAGGVVSTFLDLYANKPAMYGVYQSRSAGDLDLYVCADRPEKAQDILKCLLEVLQPVGDVCRSPYAVSVHVKLSHLVEEIVVPFDGDYPQFKRTKLIGYSDYFVKVQIIGTLVRDTGDLTQDIYRDIFSNYDLPCCAFATDGSKIYATAESLESMLYTRMCDVSWNRLKFPKRLAKYYSRGYDFNITGLPKTVQINLRSAACRAISANSSKCKESYYDTAGVMSAKCPLDALFRIYRNGGETCPIIFGNATHVIGIGKQSSEELEDWTLTQLGLECERIEKTHHDSSEAEREKALKAVEGFVSHMREIDLKPFFSKEHLATTSGMYQGSLISIEEFEEKWCIGRGEKRSLHETPNFDVDTLYDIAFKTSNMDPRTKLFIPTLRGTDKKIVINTPEMFAPCGVTYWHRDISNEDPKTLLLCIPDSFMYSQPHSEFKESMTRLETSLRYNILRNMPFELNNYEWPSILVSNERYRPSDSSLYFPSIQSIRVTGEKTVFVSSSTLMEVDCPPNFNVLSAELELAWVACRVRVQKHSIKTGSFSYHWIARRVVIDDSGINNKIWVRI